VDITSIGEITITGLDTSGGTVGWLIQTNDHTLQAVRALNATQFGIQVLGDNNHISWNSISNNGVGIRVEGSFNDLRGGTVSKNDGDGIQIGDGVDPTAGPFNKVQGATRPQDKGNGIAVQSSRNTIINNTRMDLNRLNGVLVTGDNNAIRGNTAGSSSGKGNSQDGFKVTGQGNLIDSNKASANIFDGFDISGGVASPNVLSGNQSNLGNRGGNKENKGAEFRLLDGISNHSGNKADGKGVPGQIKCAD